MNTVPAQLLAASLMQLPLVAILRGLTPAEAPGIGQALTRAGFVLLEVPLNSPQPLESLAALAAQHPDLLIGAGTVMSAADVRNVHAAGGRLIISPHFDTEVVHEALRLGLACMPGVATPSEAFAALKAGAHALKLFPAEMIGPAVVKALRAVLPVALLAAEAHWPQFRGPSADGHAPGPATPLEWSDTRHVAWKVSIPGLGWSSPVVADGKVFVGQGSDGFGSTNGLAVYAVP